MIERWRRILSWWRRLQPSEQFFRLKKPNQRWFTRYNYKSLGRVQAKRTVTCVFFVRLKNKVIE